MSPWNRIQAETEAIQSLVQLYDQARKCQDLFERAQMALPEPLKRFLGLDVAEYRSSATPPRPDLRFPLHTKTTRRGRQ